MKSIKFFKYVNEKHFNVFLKEYGYSVDDVIGFSVSAIHHFHGNVFKSYIIYFKDGCLECFKVVYFKSFNEYLQSALGFNGDTLLSWYNDANIRKYKHVIV